MPFQKPDRLANEPEDFFLGTGDTDEAGLDLLANPIRAVENQAQVESFLVLEVKVERPFGHFRLGGDVLHADLVVVPLREQLCRRVDDSMRLSRVDCAHPSPHVSERSLRSPSNLATSGILPAVYQNRSLCSCPQQPIPYTRLTSQFSFD